ncbi:S24 family peptidase [Rhodobacter capsulatus]|uniref:S24 family peptidase n=1 Tax=Rhodobacter capsulatus TaxID=1061 RepID=UPI004025905E
MEDLGKQFGDIVAQRLKALDTNAFAVEKAFGLPADAIRNVIRSEKRAGPTLSRVQEICEALDLDIYIGPRRSTSPVETVVLGNEDFAPIPRLDARMSAGPGAENGDVQVIEKLAFRRDWLDRMGVDPTQAVLVQVSGDSMTPGLHDGDLALIDRRRNKVRNGNVYALTDTDGSTRVKRIDLLPNGLILRSDAPSYPAEFRPCDDANRLQIIGQVVWSGHSWG